MPGLAAHPPQLVRGEAIVDGDDVYVVRLCSWVQMESRKALKSSATSILRGITACF